MRLNYMAGACSLAGHIVLEWIGEPYEAQRWNHDALHSPEFLRLNPAGAVPVLEDGDWVLTENIAVLHYLADTHPQAKLAGDGSPQSTAIVNRWLGLVNSDMHPNFKPFFGGAAFLDETGIEKSKANSAKKLRGYFEIVDAALEGRDWLTGERSIADPYLYVLVRWARALKLDLNGLDHLARFAGHMDADPGVQAALKAEGL